MAEKKKELNSPAPAADKKKALETALAQIEKNYGKGAIMRLGEDIPVNVESIPTGSLSLDLALGVGGVPTDRSPPVRRPWPCTSSPRRRSWAARRPSSTWSTRWSPPMPGRWA